MWVLFTIFFFFQFVLSIRDVSSNNIQGEIPYGLPPNATHMWDAWFLVFVSIANDLFNFVCNFIFFMNVEIWHATNLVKISPTPSLSWRIFDICELVCPATSYFAAYYSWFTFIDS